MLFVEQRMERSIKKCLMQLYVYLGIWGRDATQKYLKLLES